MTSLRKLTRTEKAWGWTLVLLVLAAFILIAVPRSRITADVMELLPDESFRAVPQAVTDGFASRMGREMLFAVSGSEKAAETYYRELSRIPGFEALRGKLDPEKQRASEHFLYYYRDAFLSEAGRKRLQNGTQGGWVMSQIYSPVAGVSASEIKSDPLLLMRSSALVELRTNQFATKHGWLTVTDKNGLIWYFLSGVVKPETANASRASEFLADLKEAKEKVIRAYPNTKFASEGAIFYSGYAGESARKDISTLGSVSLGLLFLLLLIAYRSVLPFSLSLLSIGAGAIAGTAATLLVFGEIHMITLLMSISLIGICTDYTTHYFTARMRRAPDTVPEETLAELRPAMLQALLTTCAAYAVLLAAPFPGLRQLGVFGISGLLAAWATVYCWYPMLSNRFAVKPLLFGGALSRYVSLWKDGRRFPAAVCIAVILFSSAGLMRLTVNDDLGSLQKPPAEIKAEEDFLRNLTGTDLSQRWFVIDADTPEEALQRKDQLSEKLAEIQKQGLIRNAILLPLNSEKTQLSDDALVKKAEPAVRKQIAALGLKTEREVSSIPLHLNVWLQDYLSRTWRRLVLGGNTKTAIMVPVQGERSDKADAALKAAADGIPGTVWVDRRGDFVRLFAGVREMVGVMLAASLSLILLFFSFRFGIRRALGILIPCCLSLAAGLGVLGAAGMSVNVFSLFALVLVLGIGIDYSIFFGNFPENADSTLFAVVTAMLTTMVSLGILIFSGTAAIQNFGLVLTAGVLTAFLTAPVALKLASAKGKK